MIYLELVVFISFVMNKFWLIDWLNNTILAGSLPFDSDIRQWTHPLMIPFIICGLNWIIERVVILNMMWLYLFLFLFGFVHSPHAQCRCFSIVCLRFQVIQIKQMQIKQVDCKMSIKISSKKKVFKTTFCDNFGQFHPQECKVTKK